MLTSASTKQKFLALDRIKIELYNAIGDKRMHFLVMLACHPKKLDKVDLIKVRNKSMNKIVSTGYRIKLFRKFTQSNLDSIPRIELAFKQPSDYAAGNRKQKDYSNPKHN